MLGVAALMVGSWALGGAMFSYRPVDLGEVVVIQSSGGSPESPKTRTTRPPEVGGSAEKPRPSGSEKPHPSGSSTDVGTVPQPSPSAPSAVPPGSAGATRVPGGPAPTAGDDEEDDDIDDADGPDRDDRDGPDDDRDG
jgi:hypothetical protein